MSGAGIVQTKLSDFGAVKADGDVRKVQTVQSSNGRDFETYMNDNSYKENADVSKTGVKESKGIDNRIKAAFNKAGSKNIEKETMSDDAMYMSQVMSETTVISDSDVIAGIKEIITEKAGITLDELEKVMKNSGLTDTDLLDNNNIRNIIMDINGISSPVELITNDTVLDTINDIVADVSDMKLNFKDSISSAVGSDINTDTIIADNPVQSEDSVAENEVFDSDNAIYTDSENIGNDNSNSAVTLTEESDYSMYQNVNNANIAGDIDKNIANSEDKLQDSQNADVTQNVENIDEGKVLQIVTDNKDVQADTALQNEMNEVTEDTEISVNEKKTDNSATAFRTDDIIKDDTEMLISENNPAEMGSNDNSELTQNNNAFSKQEQISQSYRADKEKHFDNSGMLTQNLFEHVREAVSSENIPASQSTQFTARIMNQVLDALKVVSRENMTSMEMQLNPEKLGKINVQVVAKEGIVTAHIIAQNEAVKEAIESQIAVLKDNMANQDIKIQDVEVTVSSHAFEQNLSQGGENRQNEQNGNGKRKYVNEDGHDMDIADINKIKEEVKEEIMKEQNGSSVSYQA